MQPAGTPGTPSPDPDGDGVRIHKRDAGSGRAWVYTAMALFLVCLCVVSLFRLLRPNPAGEARMVNDAADAQIGTAVGNEAGQPSRDATTSEASSAASPRLAAADDISNYIPQGEAPPMAEVIARLNKAGVHTGLGAFSPPGTSPPMLGLAVPEDFELPEGYVRHFQATDDGQRIEPILMFSPDYEFLDGAGRPIRLPPDMVVPPNMAPPGLPIRQIRIPPPLQPKDRPA